MRRGSALSSSGALCTTQGQVLMTQPKRTPVLSAPGRSEPWEASGTAPGSKLPSGGHLHLRLDLYTRLNLHLHTVWKQIHWAAGQWPLEWALGFPVPRDNTECSWA